MSNELENTTDTLNNDTTTVNEDLPDNALNGGEENPGNTAGEPEGYDVVFDEGEKQKQDPATNAEFARRRIERRRQREIERQLEEVRSGKLPENLQVNPDLPKQPDINDYLSEAAMEKYGFDQNRALAAFQQANSEWQVNAIDARTKASRSHSERVQQYTNQHTELAEAARKHYDEAEKLNLPDFEEKEEVVRGILPPGIDAQIMSLFPGKSAALLYHLGANPEKARSLLAMTQVQAVMMLTRLADSLTLKPRGKSVSKAPPADEPVQASSGGNTAANIQKKMDAAAESGNTLLYRQLKQQLRGIK